MPTGAITGHIDVAQVVLYAFWIFFAGLILYLRREDKREGYPLESFGRGRRSVIGFPTPPAPKSFALAHGGTVMAPSGAVDAREIKARTVAPWEGAPLVPTGNPMLDGVGPAAYAMRADIPDLTVEGSPKIVPLRAAPDFYLEPRDPDPRGMEVIGADGRLAGTVSDAWVDKSEYLMRYLEVEMPGTDGPHHVLLPVNFSKIDGRRRRVRVNAILADQFLHVPVTKHPDQVTFLEEERICAYYGGGTLYATRKRQEPWL
jgi:photosynthetic reaction center H subunit